ncbi:TM2 domain protein [Necator americanus]|uniref:TM2 domain protein n=1 Tax=Necator americanus TaxID=51031 RepID=W2T3C7_NECAM|nr:TM2 domain protein [Necator americanus]ETN76398.1 TM2 domain protein [Necator americanus]
MRGLLILSHLFVAIYASKRIGSAASARANSRAHCSRVDCQSDASCLSCKFPVDCELDDLVYVNCTSVKECGANQISVNREAFCRYCWQSDPLDFDCMPQSNCSTTSTQLVLTECTVQLVFWYQLGEGDVPISDSRPWGFAGGFGADRFYLGLWKSAIGKLFSFGGLGGFGADRFYLGLWKSAIGKLFSFGGLGVWTVVDVVLIATGYIRPADGSMYM